MNDVNKNDDSYLRSYGDSPLSDTAIGSGIAQLLPSEEEVPVCETYEENADTCEDSEEEDMILETALDDIDAVMSNEDDNDEPAVQSPAPVRKKRTSSTPDSAKEKKMRRHYMKLKQSRQSSGFFRKVGMPLLLTMGFLLIVAGVWTIAKGVGQAPGRAGNALQEHWVIFSSIALLMGILLVGVAGFLFREMSKSNKELQVYEQKMRDAGIQ